ncbi:MAG: TonB-dependent receptor [Acidobacteria bacterium]|nr:TonB-dependent receptor [Acidobacteriota bacterium]
MRPLLVALALALPALPQTFTSRLTGTVTDPSNALVARATITATNTGTGVKKTAVTDASGVYSIPLLLPGVYDVRIEAAGLQSQLRAAVTLETNQTATLNFALALATTTAEVTITADAPLLQSETSGVGATLETKLIERFPLPQRDVMGLVRSLPGIIAGSQVGDARGGRNVFNSNFSVGGGRTSTNEVLLDGAPNTVGDFNGVAIVPPQDSVQELRIETSSYSAEFGRTGGGTVNMVTKAGTNQFRGNAFYYVQNDAFNANSFVNNRNSVFTVDGRAVAKPVVRRHQYGYTFGGPVLIPRLYNGRNKTFFFTAYEGRRDTDPTQGFNSIPTARERSGDFSQTVFVRPGAATGDLIRLFDPLTSRTVNGARTREAFPGNLIPASRINPIARNVLALLPAPNQPGDPITQRRNFFFNGKNSYTRDVFSARVDQFFNEKHRLFVRVNWQENLSEVPNSAIRLPDSGTVYDAFRNVGLDDTWQLSPRWTNVFRASFARFLANQLPRGPFPFDPTSLGLPTYYRDNANIPILPNFSFGFVDVGGRAYNYQPRDTPSFQNQLVRSSGKHNTRLGFEHRIYKFYPFQVFNPTGSFSFGSNFTQQDHLAAAQPGQGLGLASMMLGAGSFGFEKVEPLTALNKYWGGYLQDDYRLSSRLTLNLGLRWDTESGAMESHNRLSYFDPTASLNLPGGYKGAMYFTGNGRPRSIRQANYGNFQPRIGFALRLTNKIVTRAGYGIFFLPVATETGIVTTPFNYSLAADVLNPDYTPRNTLSNPFPAGLRPPESANRIEDGTYLLGSFPGAGTVLRDQKPGYIQQWNYALSRQVGRSSVIDVTYFGSRGVHLPIPSMQLNQIDSRYLAQGKAWLETPVDNPFFGRFSSGMLSTRQVPRLHLLKPFPQYGAAGTGLAAAFAGALLYNRPPVGDSIYHAVTVKFERRFAAGLSVNAHYTFSKLIDIGGVGNGNAFNDPSALRDIYNIRLERAVSTWDVPQRLILTYSYALPFAKGNRFLGGWELFGFHTYESGRPVVVGGPDLSRLAGAGPSRAFLTGAEPRLAYQTAMANARDFDPRCACSKPWFNTAAFVTNAAQIPEYVIPNGPRTMPNLRQDWTRNVDAVLTKRFRVTETINALLDIRAFNLFNAVWFAGPNATVTSNTFGSVTAVNSAPRRLEMGLKLNF